MTLLALFLDALLAKDVPVSPDGSASPYLGPAIAIMGLEDPSPRDDGETTRKAAQLSLVIAQSRRFRMELVRRGAVELLVAQLTATGSDVATRLFVLQTLAQLALDPKAHAWLHASDAVDALLTHLQRPACGADEVDEVLRVLHCLLTSPAIRARFVELDGLATMADLVLAGSCVQKERATFVLWMLAAIPCLQETFLATKAIPALVHALEEGASDLTDVSLSALALLAENEKCRAALVAEGVVELLPRVVQCDEREEVAYRTELLEEMLAVPQRV